MSFATFADSVDRVQDILVTIFVPIMLYLFYDTWRRIKNIEKQLKTKGI